MQESGMNSDHIFLADIQDPTTYAHVFQDGLFDGLMAMGVMPHVVLQGTMGILHFSSRADEADRGYISRIHR
jgi:hypothetical protein